MWPSILKKEDHKHEVGEDTTECANCQLRQIAGEMTEFEVGVWCWYWEHVTPFMVRSGALALLISDALSGASQEARTFFLRALSSIDATMEIIDAEQKAKAQSKG